MKKQIKVILAALVMAFLIGTAAAAQADTLALPTGLTIIEDSAFEGDKSLEYVVVGENTKRIGSRAFADSGVKKIQLPDSLYDIADDAFDGVENLEVEANGGSYAYIWAVEKEYIKAPEIPADGTTQIMMPETLQAGADLHVQIFGAENALSHSLYLINNDTKKAIHREIGEKNGSIGFYGYELEDTTYTLKVYTVTDSYQTMSPLSKTVVISGSRAAGPEDIHVPEKVSRHCPYEGKFDGYEKLAIQYKYFDENGKLLEEPWCEYRADGYFHIWAGDNDVKIEVAFSGYHNGLWSAWSSVKTINVVEEAYTEENSYIYNVQIPENVQAGKDLEISFECDESIVWYGINLYRGNGGRSIYWKSGDANTTNTIIIPGYVLDVADYNLCIDYEADSISDQFVRPFKVLGSRPDINILLSTDKNEVTTRENVELQITSDGTEAAFFRFTYDERERYKGCSLDEEGNGKLITRLDYVNKGTRLITIQACVQTNDGFSEWCAPIVIQVSAPEPLPTPVIEVSDNYTAGEDIVVSIKNVEEADHYEVGLREYFSDREIKYYHFNKQDIGYGEDVRFDGMLIENGTYQIYVYADSDFRGSADAISNAIKVTGTRSSAPAVTMNREEFRIQDTVTFTIDTFGCDMVAISYYGEGYGWSVGKEYIIDATNELTEWKYTFNHDEEGFDYTFKFTVRKNDKWTKLTVIRKDVLGLPQLAVPLIHAEERYQAGANFTIAFDEVENATSYYWRLRRGNNGVYDWNRSGTIYSPSPINMEGYEIRPGKYQFTVTAQSDAYKSNSTTYEFVVDDYETKADQISVSADKTELFTNESNPVFTIIAKGAEAVRYSGNGSGTYRLDEDGMAQIPVDGYIPNNEIQNTYEYSFCVVKEGVWSEWTEPIAVTFKKTPEPEKLAETVIHIPETIQAGEDFSFSFESVEDANSYQATISYYYGGGTIYTNNTVQPNSEIQVSGKNLIAGTYIARVYAYSDTRSSSSSTITFRVNGERLDEPTVTIEPEEYKVKQKTIFTIDTIGCDQVYVSYRMTYSNGYYWDEEKTIDVTGDVTSWEYTFPDYCEGYHFSTNFSVRKNDRWSKATVIRKTVQGLPQMEAPVVTAAERYHAGRDFSITFEPVEGATSYYSWLYRMKGEESIHLYGNGSTVPITITMAGYNMEPGTYRYIVEARSDEYKTSRTTYDFTVEDYETGADAVQVMVDKTETYDDERVIASITAPGAEAICYRRIYENGNVNNTYTIRLDEDGNANVSLSGSANSNGEDRIWKYSFCAVIDDVWTAWTEPIAITFKRNETITPDPDPIVLAEPVIHIPSTIEAGQDFVFSFDTVENATSYEAYIYYYYGEGNLYRSYSPQPGTEMTVSGRSLTPGTYVVQVGAYAPRAGWKYSSITFKATGQRAAAPNITTDKETYEPGETISFTIDSEDVEDIYVSYTISDYDSGNRSITPIENSTVWTFNTYSYYQGRTCEFKFTVKKNGKWSKWKTITIPVPIDSTDT